MINLPKINLYNELLTVKKRSNKDENKSIFKLKFNPSKLRSEKLFHVEDIRKICIDYRLRFLDVKLFKGKIPNEAIKKLEEFKNQHKNLDLELKIMAPSKLFELENYDDPLLFAKLEDGYYYLIHKWGNDLSFFRKIMMWPFKSLYNIIIFMCFISLFLTLIIPKDLFQYENNPGAEFFITYLFVLKSVIAIFIYYGFALGKNFNEYIWNRKFYN